MALVPGSGNWAPVDLLLQELCFVSLLSPLISYLIWREVEMGWRGKVRAKADAEALRALELSPATPPAAVHPTPDSDTLRAPPKADPPG